VARPSVNEYFLTLAKDVALRATCPRKSVGCVIVKDRNILATGYNGSVSGLDHCDEVGCDIVTSADGTKHCVRTIHAEANAIVQAAKHGHSLRGATAYVTVTPCWPCFKLLINAGIQEIIFSEWYNPDERITSALQNLRWSYFNGAEHIFRARPE
jgi:dCMP deaminase